MELPEQWIEKAARAIAALRGSCGCDYPSCIGEECGHECERNDKWQAASYDDRERAETALRAVLPLILERAAGVCDEARAAYDHVAGQLEGKGLDGRMFREAGETSALLASAIRALGKQP